MTLQTHSSNRTIQSGSPLSRWLPIALILMVAAVLFTYKLGSEGLWIDEISSIKDASKAPLAVYEGTRKRPLYYLLLSFWMHLGSSESWLRSLSVIFAIASVFLIYKLGRRLNGEPTGLLSAALLTISPLFINHAQEVRMYALSVCMGLAGTLFLTDALLVEQSQRPSQKTLAGWTVFRVLAIYTVPLNVTLLLPDILIICWRFRKQRDVLFRFGAWLLVLLALWSPSIVRVAAAASPETDFAKSRREYLDPPGLKNLIYPLKFWMVPPQIVYKGKVASGFYKIFTLLVAGLIGAGLIRKHRSPVLLWTAAWLAVPLVPIIIFSRISSQLWEPRYVLFVCPYLFILIAAGFARLLKQWKLAAAISGAVYLFAMSWAILHYYEVQNRADYRFNAETIEQYDQPGDAIIWGYRWDEPLKYYYYDGDADIYLRDMEKLETAEGVQQWMSRLPTGHDRLWLVLENPKKATDDYKTAIANQYNVEKTFDDFGQSSIVMLVTPKSAPSISASSSPINN